MGQPVHVQQGKDTDLRERLLAAARELLDGTGVDAVTIREVARRAGVSHGAPRRYFPTRAQLLASLAQRGLDDLARRLGATDQPGDAAAQLRAAAQTYLAFAREQPALFELTTRHDLLEASGLELRQTSLAVLNRWHELVQAARPGATADDVLVLFTAVHGLAALHSRRALDLLHQDPARLLDLILARVPESSQ